jgi:hypothetical protein
MSENRHSLSGQVVRAAFAVLLVCFALNEAARLLVEVWPVPALVATVAGGSILYAHVRRSRDHW